eukprot:Pgem_evm1s16162
MLNAKKKTDLRKSPNKRTKDRKQREKNDSNDNDNDNDNAHRLQLLFSKYVDEDNAPDEKTRTEEEKENKEVCTLEITEHKMIKKHRKAKSLVTNNALLSPPTTRTSTTSGRSYSNENKKNYQENTTTNILNEQAYRFTVDNNNNYTSNNSNYNFDHNCSNNSFEHNNDNNDTRASLFNNVSQGIHKLSMLVSNSSNKEIDNFYSKNCNVKDYQNFKRQQRELSTGFLSQREINKHKAHQKPNQS